MDNPTGGCQLQSSLTISAVFLGAECTDVISRQYGIERHYARMQRHAQIEPQIVEEGDEDG
jgi:hypothetical protein